MNKYYDFFIFKYERNYIAPYSKRKKVVYSTWNLKNIKNFIKRTEAVFQNDDGLFLVKNKYNKAICKMQITSGKVTVMYKTGIKGNLYLLWRKWLMGRTVYKLLDEK